MGNAKRPPFIRLHTDELIVDSFAGGGGASTGITWALGRSPDIAINHDPEAIAMHMANHPDTKHYCENVWDVDPVEACGGKPVGLAWFSPDCTFHSKARGSKPFRDRDTAKRRRGLAWVVTRWARAVKPRVICLENVEEFQDWGPLDDDGKPDPLRAGFTFRRWKAQLEGCGYVVESRELRACDYGAPTTRKRLFVVARCDGQPICWPEQTHGKGPGLLPHRTAAECVDFSIPCPSIFERKKPLSPNTLKRIAHGIRKFVIESSKPFIVPASNDVMMAPTLIQTSYGERKTGKPQAPRILDLHVPLGTCMAQGIKHSLAVAYLCKNFGGQHPNGKPKSGPGSSLDRPLDTITCQDHNNLVTASLAPAEHGHAEQVMAFLIKYYGTDQNPQLNEPLHTITTKDRFALVTVTINGEEYVIVNIGMRMLTPRELYNAQGFDPGYVIEFDYKGKPLTKTAQVRMCGNSVCPPLARSIVMPNFGEHLEDLMKETA